MPSPLIRRVIETFRRIHGHEPRTVAVAPGRINIIGEHTDHSGGLAMPAAVDRWAVVALGSPRRGNSESRLHSCHHGETAILRTRDSSEVHPPLPSWTQYVSGALSTVGEGRAFDLVIDGNVPLGAGMSSSAALVVALLTALEGLRPSGLSGLEIARLARRVENQAVGVPCGLLDPIASACAEPGTWLWVDFESETYRNLSLPPSIQDWCWLVIHSGIPRSLAASRYGPRVMECQRALTWAREHWPEVTSSRDLLQSHAQELPNPAWARRWLHIVNENERVQRAASLAETGEFEAIGALLDQSHQSLRDLFEVSTPEMDTLASISRRHTAGARLMGGGFGGCVLALARREEAQEKVEKIVADYRDATQRPGEGWVVETVGGARVVDSGA